MRILMINPNTTQELTDRLEVAARGVISEGTELVTVTAPIGVPYISTRSEAQIGGVQVLCGYSYPFADEPSMCEVIGYHSRQFLFHSFR